MSELVQGRLIAECVWETTRNNSLPTKGFGIQAFKSAFKSAKNSSFHVEVFEVTARGYISRGHDAAGNPYTPSPAMLRVIDEVRSSYNEQPPEVATG